MLAIGISKYIKYTLDQRYVKLYVVYHKVLISALL